jgi:hypothetical protein
VGDPTKRAIAYSRGRFYRLGEEVEGE